MIPARQYSSGSEILAGAVAVRKRLFSPRKQPVKPILPAPVLRVVDRPEPRPAPRAWAEQPDSHIAAWLEWKANEPLAFLKLRCREMEVDFADIVGASVKHAHTVPRGKLMAEVKVRYSELSLPQLGRLFGGRDHTTLRAALIKHGVIASREKIANRSADIDRVRAMYAVGHGYREIAAAIGYSATTVTAIVKDNGWTRDVPPRGVSSHTDAIHKMFESGKSIRAIAAEIGHSRDAVRIFLKKKGWTR